MREANDYVKEADMNLKAIIFSCMAIAGTALLCLPRAAPVGQSLSWSDAGFTSFSERYGSISISISFVLRAVTVTAMVWLPISLFVKIVQREAVQDRALEMVRQYREHIGISPDDAVPVASKVLT